MQLRTNGTTTLTIYRNDDDVTVDSAVAVSIWEQNSATRIVKPHYTSQMDRSAKRLQVVTFIGARVIYLNAVV